MSHEALASASGLRPMSAFVVIATVMLSVAAWIVNLSWNRAAEQPLRTSCEEGAPPTYSIADRQGRVLAQFVPRFDLEMSPRSMWQAHTPERMAHLIADVLGDGGPDATADLLTMMLPDAEDGMVAVDAWDLSPRQASRLVEWIDSGAESGTGPLEGIWIEHAPDGSTYRLCWEPAVLLSTRERERHHASSAWVWARRLGNGLASALRLPHEPEPATPEEWQKSREQVWAALIPKAYCRPLRDLPPDRALVLRELLEEEGVAPWQMRIAYGRNRRYPLGEDELFGDWGFSSPEQKTMLPRRGLELYCDRLLAEQRFASIDYRPEAYTWLQDRTVRGERANGFVSYAPASTPPLVRSTLDLGLQRHVRRELERVMKEHEPAVAMAIVLELDSGEVLAVDSVEQYEIEPFAPVYHAFTPGSTFKMVTMAIALEEGAIRPEEDFEVGQGEYRLVDPKTGRARIIHEAEGSLHGNIKAWECFAYSVNAGLVQIGLRVPAETFRSYLTPLGYGSAPGANLGIERAGYLRSLPWKYTDTHASVTFGHELTTTLWQHATALSAIARGGVWRPLRLVQSVEQETLALAPEKDPERRVFGERTCDVVRDMMALGASEGTGRHISLTSVDMGTKTGTAQKVPTELCAHVELGARARLAAAQKSLTRDGYRALKSEPKPHRNCYTSSMCVVGRLAGDEREVMVLVVVDEPRGKEKYGSKVAGPAAARILAEGLGMTRNGVELETGFVEGFGNKELAIGELFQEPWREGR